jgi:hypothetical protein
MSKEQSVGAGVILIRTHYVDDYLMGLAETFSENGLYEVAFAIDERERHWDTGRFGKVSITYEAMAALNLYTGADPDASLSNHSLNAFWRCGDYVLYLALDQFPHADRLWMIENDVLINMARPQDLFTRLDAQSADDLLATHVGPAMPDWFWWKTVSAAFPQPYRCFFPLVRVSRRAAEHLRDRRRRDRDMYLRDGVDLDLIPNDEAFVASVLSNEGFSIADVNNYGVVYEGSRFDFWTLLNRHRLPPVDDRLYHSVRAGRHFLQALRRKMPDIKTLLSYVKDDPEITPAMVLEDIAIRLSEAPHEQVVLAEAAEELPFEVLRLLLALDARRGELPPEALSRRLLSLEPDDGNIAFRRPAFQSSVSDWSNHYHPCVDAQGATDGALDQLYNFHTDEEDAPWWAVDLLQDVEVARVVIHNRSNMPWRLNGFRIELSSDARHWTVAYATELDQSASVTEDITLPPGLRGRFLRILVPQRTCLHLVQVEVFQR